MLGVRSYILDSYQNKLQCIDDLSSRSNIVRTHVRWQVQNVVLDTRLEICDVVFFKEGYGI